MKNLSAALERVAWLLDLNTGTNSAEMTFEVSRAIHADHPTLPGHFPGAPLVPGVVILDEVLDALLQRRSDCDLAAIRFAKFLAPLRPEQTFTIRFSADDDDAAELDFHCLIGDRIIAEGRLEISWHDTMSS
jgi:3-hydroxymyristoyl/3-hydroxydecanoyl-(acyl carrier protein) dehydratase